MLTFKWVQVIIIILLYHWRNVFIHSLFVILRGFQILIINIQYLNFLASVFACDNTMYRFCTIDFGFVSSRSLKFPWLLKLCMVKCFIYRKMQDIFCNYIFFSGSQNLSFTLILRRQWERHLQYLELYCGFKLTTPKNSVRSNVQENHCEDCI